MRRVGMHEAKTHLSQLVREVEAGEEVVVLRGGVPVARLVPYTAPIARQLGMDRGALLVPDDFDAPLPDDVLDAFDGDAPV